MAILTALATAFHRLPHIPSFSLAAPRLRNNLHLFYSRKRRRLEWTVPQQPHPCLDRVITALSTAPSLTYRTLTFDDTDESSSIPCSGVRWAFDALRQLPPPA